MFKCIFIFFLLLSYRAMAQDERVDTTVSTESQDDTSVAEEELAADTVSFRAIPDTTIARLKSSKDFRYANDPSYWKRDKPADEEPRFSFFGTFNYLLLGVFIVLIVYALSQILIANKIVVFKKNKKFTSPDDAKEDSPVDDMDALITKAELEGDLRTATRFRYLKLLEALHQRQLIHMQAELTNWDYVKQLANHPLNKRFRYLTVAYDYVWYGEFQPTHDQYEILRNNFQTFLQ